MDGEPTANILVSFQPTLGAANGAKMKPGSYGITNADGRYKLEWADGSGAVPAEHTVTLIYRDPNHVENMKAAAGGPETIPEFKLPLHARDGSITFTVPEGGTKEADFAFDSEAVAPAPNRPRLDRR